MLVFTDGDRSMGLMVDEIVDVVEDRLNIELSGARPGMLGTAVIGGHATDVLDTGYWLTQAWQDWFHGAPRDGGRRQAAAACCWSRTATSSASCWCRLWVPPAIASPPRPARPRRCGCAMRARCST